MIGATMIFNNMVNKSTANGTVDVSFSVDPASAKPDLLFTFNFHTKDAAGKEENVKFTLTDGDAGTFFEAFDSLLSTNPNS